MFFVSQSSADFDASVWFVLDARGRVITSGSYAYCTAMVELMNGAQDA